MDDFAFVLDPGRAGKLLIIGFGRDRVPCASVTDVLAKAVARIAAVAYHSLGHAGHLIEHDNGMRQLVDLPRGDSEGDGALSPVGDHAGLGAIAAT